MALPLGSFTDWQKAITSLPRTELERMPLSRHPLPPTPMLCLSRSLKWQRRNSGSLGTLEPGDEEHKTLRRGLTFVI